MNELGLCLLLAFIVGFYLVLVIGVVGILYFITRSVISEIQIKFFNIEFETAYEWFIKRWR